MSIYEEELEGREFDWFAIDSEGNIGLFSTAGEGKIPGPVMEAYSEHDNISEQLESPNWGSSEVWSDYAVLGLYVYDWDLPGGPYKRVRAPSKAMSDELKTKLLNMGSLYSIPTKFVELKEISCVLLSM
ncbi:hypothetical protein MJO52_12185 [Microbulbifer variabilis]|uniref:Uncharacterized protein n=1 Tax=Microbulbifer variabilis TaxID=266805 RepID=A0ABY4V6D6_9GAMM|nr:hypothetical protein [Microbulbifer variabilis]USD19840.1 hypothetical protein MJO52_12185 [Microbulbifer variabilis]